MKFSMYMKKQIISVMGVHTLILAALIFFSVSVSARAADNPSPRKNAPASSISGQIKSSGKQEADSRLSPVILHGNTLFSVRGIKSFSSEQQAKAISERIKKLAEDLTVKTNSITTVDTDISTDVVAGDRIQVGDITGDVIETRHWVTVIRTTKNEEAIIPNSALLNSNIINYSTFAREKGLILHTTLTIGYDAPWRQVHALLLMAAERTPGILREPSPFILQKSLGDFYVSYELNAYTDAPQAIPRTYSNLHKNIQDAFNEFGVQIMSPNYRFDPEQPKIVPKERWYAPPAKPDDEPVAELTG